MEKFYFVRKRGSVFVQMYPATPTGHAEAVELVGISEDDLTRPAVAAALAACGATNWRTREVPSDTAMRLTLALLVARQHWQTFGYSLGKVQERFKARFQALPNEVLLYWFTGCCYGRMQEPFRAAFACLMTLQGSDV